MSNGSQQKGNENAHGIIRAVFRVLEVPFVVAAEVLQSAVEVVVPPETSRG